MPSSRARQPAPQSSRKVQSRQTQSSAKMASELVSHSRDAAQSTKTKQQELLEGFEPQPSLWPAVSFLYHECLVPLVTERCSVCEKHLVPSDPARILQVPRYMMPERLFCGHIYHLRCLETYINNPPFDKGCKVCGQTLSHHKFCTDAKVLESRWAFKEARQREIDDVKELML
uniref:Upf0668 protein n=1 Tax=Tetraselmis sp. GSL018 TaxID=582737 RepID=A0A061R5L2_9CHLO